MKRSLAPSQLKRRLQEQKEREKEGPSKTSSRVADGSVTIERMPLFDFLSIPESLKKKFRVPSGCVITKESIALRKVKTLGLRKVFKVFKPGDFIPPTVVLPSQQQAETEDESVDVDKSEELPPYEPLVLWADQDDPEKVIEVIPQLACRLRPHQREGVQFLFECTMGLRGFDGEGCILADDMGLGKTLMSITLLWTLLNQGFEGPNGPPAVRKAVVVCPTSLVGNWENELKKWIGDHCPTFAVHTDPKKRIKQYIQHRGKGILIVSYETQRRYSSLFLPGSGTALLPNNGSPCELLICDEAHKLKNAECGIAKSLSSLPARKRVLLSGTPMQNELLEFFNMVDFCNPGVLGTPAQFRKTYERPILLSREPDASEKQVESAARLQKQLSTIVNEFILKRGNILNAQHLPPKLVQYVCCRLTPLQNDLYDLVIQSKHKRHLRDGKQLNVLNSLRHLLSICSHPEMVVTAYRQRQSGSRDIGEDECLEELAQYMTQYAGGEAVKGETLMGARMGSGGVSRQDRALIRSANKHTSSTGRGGVKSGFDPELSGKFLVLYRLMQTLRVLPDKDRIVVVSNSTQTLDLIEAMCRDNGWPSLRLDGSTPASRRTRIVTEFNDLRSNSFAFLLSSKAGGCGINLIGGNRLVLFDPDWNPASDKQAAARIWREGQRKRCYIYRFMSTCTIEEKIIQRQLSKEGLQNIIDDKDQVNQFSSSELKSIFRRRTDTRSDTHDTLRCRRCKNVRVLPCGVDEWQQLNPQRVEMCIEFLNAEMPQLAEVLNALEAVGSSPSDFKGELEQIALELRAGGFETLPAFSKRLRSTIKKIDDTVLEAMQSSTVLTDFLSAWTKLVPNLTAAVGPKSSSRHAKEREAGTDKENVSNDNTDCENDDEEEFVEQEGCPDEEDFNRWSHHCSVNTCDDEALQLAMGDDSTVSFVFGLEVNWSLLQAKVALEAEEEERKKEQLRKDIEELNRQREKSKKQHLESFEEDALFDDCSERKGKNSKSRRPLTISKPDHSDCSSESDCEFLLDHHVKHCSSGRRSISHTTCAREPETGGQDDESREWRTQSGNNNKRRRVVLDESDDDSTFENQLENESASRVDDITDKSTCKRDDTSVMSADDNSHSPLSKNQCGVLHNNQDQCEYKQPPLSSEELREKECSEIWACPECTLHNDIAKPRCSACGFSRRASGSRGRLALPPR